MTTSVLEVTKDIIVAMISKQNSSTGAGLAEPAAIEVAKAFEVIYNKVRQKENGG